MARAFPGKCNEKLKVKVLWDFNILTDYVILIEVRRPDIVSNYQQRQAHKELLARELKNDLERESESHTLSWNSNLPIN